MAKAALDQKAPFCNYGPAAAKLAAFDIAQAKVFNIVPDDDDEPLGPDPDVNKCICRGTGKIAQGDGHTTDCPYHSVSSPAPVVNEVEAVEIRAYCPTVTMNLAQNEIVCGM